MSITKETRRESYEAILPKAPTRQQLILDILDGNQMTAHEITEALYKQGHIPFMERNFASPRLTELQEAGEVRAIGKRICSRTGRKVAVWERMTKENND